MQPKPTSRIGEKAKALPDCVFIQSNLPAPRPGPSTTATKEGRAKMTKKARKNPALEKKKKQPPAGRKKKTAAGRKD